MPIQNISKLSTLLETTLPATRIPGVAVAVVAGGETILAQGFGYRDLDAKLPMTADTIYPIASTTKAFNATLLGMLVDEGRLAWDAPVQQYLPRFHLHDRTLSAQITLRDLVSMRTGLPRHDYVWLDSGLKRAEILARLVHLPLSAGLRERFQYNNLTTTVAGLVAETVTGRSWEQLLQERILEPLDMRQTSFEVPTQGNATLAYHENTQRRLITTRRVTEQVVAPAGGSVHSTVNDMTKWLAFNLSGNSAAGRSLIAVETLRQIHAPCMVMGSDPAAPSPAASYGLGWFVDTYNGAARVSHTGLMYDVNGCVSLFPEQGIGVVSFSNFASARLAQIINQYAFDLIVDRRPVRTFEQAQRQYEQDIENTRRIDESVSRITGTAPSHPLHDYAGTFEHPGYGRIVIRRHDQTLILERHDLVLPLEHWHYDAWVAASNDLFEIHRPQTFDRSGKFLFDTNADGAIAGLSLVLEPALDPVRFEKQ